MLLSHTANKEGSKSWETLNCLISEVFKPQKTKSKDRITYKFKANDFPQ